VDINKLITKTYDKLYEVALHVSNEQDAKELLHEALLVLLEYKEKGKADKLRELNTKSILFFVSRIMVNMYHSNTSRYYYKYRKFYKHIVIGEDRDSINGDKFIFNNKEHKEMIEKKLEFIDMTLKTLYWYDRELFRLYFFGEKDGRRYSLTSLAKKTGISRNSIFNTIKNVKQIIKKKYYDL
jgi:hypothetical protein